MTTDSTVRSRPIELVISDTPVIIRQLHWPGFRRIDMHIRRAEMGTALVDLVREAPPDALVLQARLPDQDAFSVLDHVRRQLPVLPVVIVSLQGMFPSTADDQDQHVSILSCPLSRGQLFNALTPFLGLSSRGMHAVTAAVSTSAGRIRQLKGTITHLAVSGARLVLPLPLEERLSITLQVKCTAGAASLPSRVIWCRSNSVRPEERHPDTESTTSDGEDVELSVQFVDLQDETRDFLRRVTTWEMTLDPTTGRQQVHLLRGLTEMSDLSELPELLSGTVEIDLSLVNVVYSVGVTRWIKFLRQIPADVHYRFNRCSTAFCLQASSFEDLLGRGEAISVYAPYCCSSCAYEGERLIHIADVDMSSFPPTLPGFACPWCGSQMHFEDLPERYFSFLRT